MKTTKLDQELIKSLKEVITYEQVRYKPRLKLKATKVERSKKSYTRKVKHKDGR